MKRSERILLILFLTTAISLGSLALGKQFVRQLTDLREREHASNLRRAESEVYLERKDFWLTRAKWLADRQPEIGSPDQVDNELVNLARAIDVPGVATEKLKLLEPEMTPDYRQVGISFVAKGTMRDVFGWLHQLQRPAEFRAIGRLKVLPDREDPSLVSCEVVLLRWYAP